MRRVPSVLAATSAFLLMTALPARAATCPMLTDPAGDGQWDLVPAVEAPMWDVVSADVATGPTTLVAVLRVADLSVSDSNNALLMNATQWMLGWSIGTARHEVELRSSFGAIVAEYTWYDAGGSATILVPVTFDRSASTITWTVPRSAVPGLSGATLYDLVGLTKWWGASVDNSFSPAATFVDGTAGCVSAL